jgi:hypothetical protein
MSKEQSTENTKEQLKVILKKDKDLYYSADIVNLMSTKELVSLMIKDNSYQIAMNMIRDVYNEHVKKDEDIQYEYSFRDPE